MASQLGIDCARPSNQGHTEVEVAGRGQRAVDDMSRSEVATHGVDGDLNQGASSALCRSLRLLSGFIRLLFGFTRLLFGFIRLLFGLIPRGRLGPGVRDRSRNADRRGGAVWPRGSAGTR
jgi:hypothetical protein